MTSSNGNIFRVTGHLYVFCDARRNKRLSKQPWGWWFETPTRSLWCLCSVVTGVSLARVPMSQTNMMTSWHENFFRSYVYLNTLRSRQMNALLLTTFLNAFCWKFHHILFLIDYLTINIGSNNGLKPNSRKFIFWTNDCLVYWCVTRPWWFKRGVQWDVHMIMSSIYLFWLLWCLA